MTTSPRIAVLFAALALAACAPPPPPPEPPDTRAADEAAIRANAREWSAAAQAKDVEKFLSFYAEDAVVMMAGAPDLSGSAVLREALGGVMSDPNFSLAFETDKVVVARSGDLAYETGPYTMTMSGPDGALANEQGHSVVVWRKQADGAWKVAVDAPISDPLPEAPPQP